VSAANRLSIVLLGVAACNQVFDLEPTQSTNPIADVDNDGVADSNDNCPTLANDQVNSDGDPFGDACDACPMQATATTHDEDGDAVGDECDLCPGFEDLGADLDLDRIGDRCDPNPANMASPDRRISFEPFVAMPSGWQVGTTAWTVADDSIGPDVELDANDPGLTTSITTGTGHWASVGIFFARTRWQPPDRFGLVAKGPSQTFSCVVTCTTTNAGCVGHQRVNGQIAIAFAIPPRPSMLVAMYVQNANAAGCVFEGNNLSNPQFSTVATSGMAISVLASPRIRATYFEHLE
jgi:hypothetical protein